MRQTEREGMGGDVVAAKDFYTESGQLPKELMQMEVLFNVGRAFHQVRDGRRGDVKVSLFHVATRYYRGVLQLAERLRCVSSTLTAVSSTSTASTASNTNSTKDTTTKREETVMAMFSLEKAAAYNLCLILQTSGAHALAASVRRRYLTFDSGVC